MRLQDLFPGPGINLGTDEVIIRWNMAKRIDQLEVLKEDLLRQNMEQQEILDIIADKITMDGAGYIQIPTFFPSDKEYPEIRKFYERRKDE